MELPRQTLDWFEGDELRARVFFEKYALQDIDGTPLEFTPEEMWERIAKGLAEVEETEEKRREWYEKFRWLLSNFRFVPGGRIMHAVGNPRKVTPFNCFPAGTKVLTRDGLKPIEAVRAGDEVLTHRNRFRKVTHVIAREINEPLCELRLWYLNDAPIRCTQDHLFLCLEGEQVKWVPAAAITPQHYIKLGRIDEDLPVAELDIAEFVSHLPIEEDEGERLFTAVTYIGGNGAVGVAQSRRVRRKIRIDERFGLWLGYFIAEGGITEHSVYFTFSKDEPDYAQEVATLTEELFGVSANIQWREGQEGHWLRVWVNSNLLAAFLRQFFPDGVHAHEKRLPSWFLMAPKSVQRAFIAGLFRGDGTEEEGGYDLCLANPDLIRQVWLILLRLGMLASLRWETPSPHTQHPTMRLGIHSRPFVDALRRWISGDFDFEAPPTETPTNYFYRVKDGEVFVKVKSVRLTERRQEVVYDLTVEDDHSFTAEFACAHNCFVLPIKDDSLEAIFECAKEMARTYSQGGGVGIDISVLRPAGSPVRNAARTSTGAVSFMELYSMVTGTIGQHGRRGALMITIADNHPDVLAFIDIKNDPERRRVRYANISVRVSDELMEAVQRNGKFELRFDGEYFSICRTVDAREIWDKLIQNAWSSAEPGCLFWSTIKRYSTSEYNGMEVISTNPCGEEPLPAYGNCNLGNINLSAFVLDEFTDAARVDWESLEKAVRYAVRFLDNVITYAVKEDRLPLPQQKERCAAERRIGVGFTGLGDMLAQLRLKYDTDDALEFVDELFHKIKCWAYDESINLAIERGPFPLFDPEKHLQMGFIRERLPRELQEKIRRHGIRNVCVLTVPPVGSGAAMAGVTSGIEPIFALSYIRRSESLSKGEFKVFHPCVRRYMEKFGIDDERDLPDFFVTAHQIIPEMRVRMQAIIQSHIDQSISSTINLPHDITTQEVERIYFLAWRLGCKGITVYREGSREGVLITEEFAQQKRGRLMPKPRPMVLVGKTYKLRTEMGNVYVTVNADEEGPQEVFVRLGKSGSSAMAFTEAIGRLISLALRAGVSPDAIVDQLSGIKSSSATRQENGTIVFSVPDAVAKALEMYLKGENSPKGSALAEVLLRSLSEDNASEVGMSSIREELPQILQANGAKYTGDLCPNCGEPLIHTGGCDLCLFCGYSRCQ
jgi:ribonucleoside-diphosphate reductase alpha chain